MKNLGTFFWICMAVLPLVVGAGQVRADAIFNNFGPGDTYFLSGGYTIGSGSVGFSRVRVDQGDAFTPVGTGYTLDQIVVAIGFIFGPNILDLWLMNDTAGMPGTIIDSFHLVDAMFPYNGVQHPPVVAHSVLHPLLQEGTQYWIIASAPINTGAVWPGPPDLGIIGPHAAREDEGPWRVEVTGQAAFRVEGTPVPSTPVPEPVALSLFTIGALVVICAGWKRKTAASERINSGSTCTGRGYFKRKAGTK